MLLISLLLYLPCGCRIVLAEFDVAAIAGIRAFGWIPKPTFPCYLYVCMHVIGLSADLFSLYRILVSMLPLWIQMLRRQGANRCTDCTASESLGTNLLAACDPKKIYRLKEDQAFSLSLELGRREKFARQIFSFTA
jgi:hypothetical protein